MGMVMRSIYGSFLSREACSPLAMPVLFIGCLQKLHLYPISLQDLFSFHEILFNVISSFITIYEGLNPTMCRMNGVNLKLLSLKNIGMSLLELSYLLTFLLSLCFRVNVFINIYVCRKCFWYCLYLHFKICIYRVSLSSLVCLLRAIFYY